MNMEKEKIIYDNQEKVLEKVILFLKSFLNEDIREAYLFGSIVEKRFGKYIKKYKVHNGSDIDLIVFLAEGNILKNWKNLNTEKSWWKLYRGGKIEINGTIHKIDVLVVKKDMEEIAKKSKIFEGEILRIK